MPAAKLYIIELNVQLSLCNPPHPKRSVATNLAGIYDFTIPTIAER